MSKSNRSAIDMILDPVVEEVRERGRRVTQRFDNDPKKLFRQLEQLAEKHPEKMVGQVRVVAISQAERETV